jgi:hypothetical protein
MTAVEEVLKLLKVNDGYEFDSIDKVAGLRRWLRGLLRLVRMLHGTCSTAAALTALATIYPL